LRLLAFFGQPGFIAARIVVGEGGIDALENIPDAGRQAISGGWQLHTIRVSNKPGNTACTRVAGAAPAVASIKG